MIYYHNHLQEKHKRGCKIKTSGKPLLNINKPKDIEHNILSDNTRELKGKNL